MGKPKVVLISHTHWDREWYYTFEKFRYRLAQCLDEVLRLLEDPSFHSFMLDGQVAPIDDYLELRPEMREKVVEAVRRGRLLIGPWYVQPDELLVDEESLVRNLLYGKRRAAEYGGWTPIGYLPDTFGHTAQLPQILRGFGIDTFVFHRGLGPEFEEVGTPFIWAGPDGSEVIALFLLGGYCNLAWLPPDAEAAAAIIVELYKRWEKHTRISSIPGMVGCDHHLPKSYLPSIARELAAKDLPVEVVQGTLLDVLAEARASANRLSRLGGELLSSHYHWVLYGVWSTRSYLKVANFECENLLLFYVEPLWALAWLLAGRYPEREIWAAWRYVLLCHPHDSICGCGVDGVHREVMSRLEKARELARELLECTGRGHGALDYFLAGRAGYRYEWHAMPLIASTVKLDFAGYDASYYIAFNTLPWRRKTVVKLRLKPYALAALSLDEMTRTAPRRVVEGVAELIKRGLVVRFDPRGIALRDSHGRVVPVQAKELDGGVVEAVWVDELPAAGFKAYAAQPAEPLQTDLRWGRAFIENRHLRVEFDLENGGAMRIVDKRSGEVYEGLAYLEDGGDIGDEYDYSPPERDRVVTSRSCRASFEVVEAGPVYVRARVSFGLRVPASASPDRRARSEEEVELPVELYATLYTELPRVDVEVRVENRARDHRLRIAFPTGVRAEKHAAKTHYMVIERPNKPPYYYVRGEGKVPVSTWPTRLWVDVSDGRRGLCVAAKGLHEYEVREGAGGCEIVYTLLRAVGWLSRNDLLTRPGHAGPEIPTPEAQCLGTQSFELTVIPHTGSWSDAGVHKAALEWAVPGLAHEDVPHPGELPPEFSLLEVEGDPLLFSTMKRSEDGRALVLRIYNPSPREVEARVAPRWKAMRVWRARLDETPIEALGAGEVKLRMGPYKVETLRLEPL
ncbi:MAG: glycoside hydrolase family 38 C-terminal domain-containing protein [Thermofilaceae archaeon]